MYKTIVNPETGRKVKVNGKIGKKVLNSYKKQFQLGGDMNKKRRTEAPRIEAPRHPPLRSEKGMPKISSRPPTGRIEAPRHPPLRHGQGTSNAPKISRRHNSSTIMWLENGAKKRKPLEKW